MSYLVLDVFQVTFVLKPAKGMFQFVVRHAETTGFASDHVEVFVISQFSELAHTVNQQTLHAMMD